MKRRLFKLVLFLLLGVIVTVATAWLCVTVEFRGEVESVLLSEYEQAWLQNTGKEPRRNAAPVDASDGFGWEKREIFLHDDQYVKLLKTVVGIPSGLVSPDFTSIRGGWPFHCLSGEAGVHGSPERFERRFVFHVYGTSILLPIRPIWKGFIANTLFYALILWVLAPYVRSLSVKTVALCRQHFHKPGHCIKCGYDLCGNSGGEVCPECGKELCKETKP